MNCYGYRSPVSSIGKGTFLTKLWPTKKNASTESNTKALQSSESRSTSAISPQDSLHVVDEAEGFLPAPPPTPTVEFLLGKRPANLRGKKIIPHEVNVSNEEDERLSDIDSDHSSVSSSHSDRISQPKKKAKKKRRKGSKEDDIFEWQYNKLTVPQSSPPRERKARMRKLTPVPARIPYGGLSQGIASAFDEVSRELEMASTPVSDSPTIAKSPNQVSPPQQKPQHNSHIKAKQAAPPEQQHIAQPVGRQPNTTSSQPKRAAPISLMGSSRKPLPKQQPETSGSQQSSSRPIGANTPSSPPTIQQMIPFTTQSSYTAKDSGVQVCVSYRNYT